MLKAVFLGKEQLLSVRMAPVKVDSEETGRIRKETTRQPEVPMDGAVPPKKPEAASTTMRKRKDDGRAGAESETEAAAAPPTKPKAPRDDTVDMPMKSKKRPPQIPTSYYESPRVYIRVVFMKVGQIDTVGEKYEADIYIQARWREPELDRDYGSTSPRGEDVNWDNYWNPELIIQNIIESKKDSTWKTVEHAPSGEAFVVERRRVKGNFSESMELQSFPFDTQSLSVLITSEEQDIEFMEDNTKPSRINHANFVDQQEWSAWDIVEFAPSDSGAEDSLAPEQPVVTFRIFATRQSGFFVWNIFAVMALILSLFLCTWSVDRKYPTNRLQLSFTLVLTTVAFKFVANQSLPKVSYTTVLDKYIIGSLTIMHIASCFHAIVTFFPEGTDGADFADMIGFIVLASLFVLFQVLFVLLVKNMIGKQRRSLKLMQRQYKSRVDRLASGGGEKRQSGRKGGRFSRGVAPYS